MAKKVSLLMRLSARSAVFLVILSVASQSLGLNIVRNFDGGTAPGSAAGGGTLSEVFDAAADWWEMAILDNHTVTINFSWAPLTAPTLAETLVFPPRPSEKSTIKFDNDGSTSWFIDPTPYRDDEWTTFTETDADLGGGLINVGRIFSGPTGDAVGRYDLLTVAKHEIGHALNVVDLFRDAMDDPTTTTVPRPNPDTKIFTTSAGGGHIDPAKHPNALMVPSVPLGQRKLQTGIDILLAAERGGFTDIVLDPLHIPEPSSFILALFGLLALVTRVRRRA